MCGWKVPSLLDLGGSNVLRHKLLEDSPWINISRRGCGSCGSNGSFVPVIRE